MPMYSKKTSRVVLHINLLNNKTENWYSLPKDDKKGIDKTIQALAKRILQKKHNNKFIRAVFYDTSNNTIIKVIDNSVPETMYSKNLSKVRLELTLFTGKKETWYSMFNDDEKSLEKAVLGLSNRILKNRHNNTFKLAIFYNNLLNTEIKKIGNEYKHDKHKSLIRLVIYLKNGKIEIWHSDLNNDTKGLQFSADKLYDAYAKSKNYQTALMYMNPNAGYDNTLIHKWIDGTKIL